MLNLYDNKNYKLFVLLPIALFVIFLFLVFVYPTVPKGIDLSGGTLVRISLVQPVDTTVLKQDLLSRFSLEDLQLNTTSSPLGDKLLIQFSFESNLEKARVFLEQAKKEADSNPQNSLSNSRQALSALAAFYSEPLPANASAVQALIFTERAFNTAKQNFSNQLNDFLVERLALGSDAKISKGEVGAALGKNFYSNALFVSVVAFIFLAIVLFAFFREIVPSLAMLLVSVFDILGALALMAVFSIPLSLSTIPALLMLIGYAVDTEILLTTRVMKRKDKDTASRAWDASITGFTMTMTALVTLAVMIALSYFIQIQVLFEISVVLFFGLLADIISNWALSAPFIIWYASTKKGKGE